MVEITSLNGMYLAFYLNNIIYYFFLKEKFFLYAAMFHITLSFLNVVVGKTENFICEKKSKFKILSLFKLSAAFTMIFDLFTKINKLTILPIILILIVIGIYITINLIWFTYNIIYFKNNK